MYNTPVILVCLLARSVVVILAESDDLPAHVIDILEEVYPVYKQVMALMKKCDQEYPIVNEDDEAERIAYEESKKCWKQSEANIKINELKKKYGDIIAALSQTQQKSIEKYLRQDEWSRVLPK